jgi:hypothetical protein
MANEHPVSMRKDGVIGLFIAHIDNLEPVFRWYTPERNSL